MYDQELNENFEDWYSSEGRINKFIYCHAERKNSISSTNANRLMLFRERIGIYCENLTK
jgi:hypothetical protein